MSTSLPSSIRYAVVGAGVHGLSTAWHMAMALEKRGGSGAEVIVLDKTGPGAGSTGVACGCVRAFYMTEALHPIIRHSVDVWNYDPVRLGFQQVGYVSCGESNQIADYERMHASQQRAGYTSDMYVGKEARDFLTGLWPDFHHHSIDVVLHERLSGYAGTAQMLRGLTELCERHGVRIYSGVEVEDYDMANGRCTGLVTNQGRIGCEVVVLGLGPWTAKHWQKLGLPMTMDVGYRDGSRVADKDTWTYWRLEEAELYYDGPYATRDGFNPPVLHIELMNTPVVDPATGAEIKDNVYVYWKNGTERMERPGIQGGVMPVMLGPEAETEPYGHANPRYQPGAEFPDYMSACMSMFMDRFEGIRADFKERPSGGIGAFTADNVPIFDWVRDNVYMIADSGHGFKMTGVGKLVADHIVNGANVADLEPFGLGRFAAGQAFGSGTTHCPWV